jgi:hypothetical protein
VDCAVAVVGLGVDAMECVLLEELGDDGLKRFGRQTGAGSPEQGDDGPFAGTHAEAAIS